MNTNTITIKTGQSLKELVLKRKKTEKKITIKTVYLSGKISGLPTHEMERNFSTAAIECVNTLGVNISLIKPHRYKPLFNIDKWIFYMIPCIRRVKKSHIIAMHPSWTESKGAVVEYFFAKFIYKIEIIFLQND